MNFPEWAPKDLVKLYESASGIPRENRSVLKRLLIYKGMDKVWKLVEQHGPFWLITGLFLFRDTKAKQRLMLEIRLEFKNVKKKKGLRFSLSP